MDFDLIPIEQAKRRLSSLRRPIIGIFDGGSVPHRIWPYDRVLRLIKTLNERGYSVVVVGGKNELLLSLMIKRELKLPNNRFLDFIGKTSLLEITAVLSQLDLLISTDSSLLHLAYAVGIKTVALFGPGIPEKWAPGGRGHIVIRKNMPCSPCTKFGYTPPCPYAYRCMKEIKVDDVMDGVEKAMKGE